MASLQCSSIFHSSCSSSSSRNRAGPVKATINLPKRLSAISLPGLHTRQELDFRHSKDTQLSPIDINTLKEIEENEADSLVVAKMYSIMEAVSDRIEMHKNIGEQRNDWNSLLLTSINAMTLAAATMAGIAATSGGAGAPVAALKLSSTILYLSVTGMLSIMNKIIPSQLAEEQRNAARLFKQLHSQIQTTLAIGNPRSDDVEEMMEKVLTLDKAYPLPLLGAMLEKFPANVEPAVWWPKQVRGHAKAKKDQQNGWNESLEQEMRETAKVIEKKDKEDYLRLGGKALKLNKGLAICGPVLTGLAAIGSVFVGSPSHDSWPVALAVIGGAFASAVNTLEHGGQVGMVVEMYRSNAGFFNLVEESIESNLAEKDLTRRENGEVFEMKMALQLGRSLSELRDLAASSSSKGEDIDEFASKLF